MFSLLMAQQERSNMLLTIRRETCENEQQKISLKLKFGIVMNVYTWKMLCIYIARYLEESLISNL